MKSKLAILLLACLTLISAACGGNAAADAAVDEATPATPDNSLSLTWHDGDTCTTAILQADSGVQTGPCDGALTSYPFSTDTPEAVNLLTNFNTIYAPFAKETAVGDLTFHSTLGTTIATPSQQRQIAETARWLVETAVAGRSSAANYLVLSWHREGGLAGFCDDLAIYTTGRGEATSCKGTTAQISLNDAQLNQLYAWLDTFPAFDAAQNDPAGAADAMQISLRFNGRGSEDPQEMEQTILAFAADLVGAQSAGPGSPLPPLPTTDATTVIDGFLASLQDDPTGAHSLDALSSSLQAEAAAGKPIPAIIGVQNLIPAYSLTSVDDGSASGQAIVVATLAYETPYRLTFYLAVENGAWRIDRVAAATAAYQPLTDAECATLRDTVAAALGTQADLREAEFNDFVTGQSGRGCEISVSGTGETFGSFLDVAAQLQAALGEAGWTPDMAYLADGPTGTAVGLRQGSNLALLSVNWQPSADANCPADQIITACDLTPAQQLFTITLNVAAATNG